MPLETMTPDNPRWETFAEILNRATHEIRHQYLSADKARTVLQWAPLFTLDEGLERTVAWYRRLLDGSDDPSSREASA